MKKTLLALSLISLIVFPSVFAWDGRMALDADKRNLDHGETIKYQGHLYWEYPIDDELVYITVKEQKTGKILLESSVNPETTTVSYFNNTAWPFSFTVDTSETSFRGGMTYVVEAKYDDKSTKLDFLIKESPMDKTTQKDPVKVEEKTPALPSEPEITTTEIPEPQKEMMTEPEEISEGGGCLIATAAFGTEFASEVQLLREVRDKAVMSTASGSAFMTGFNQVYYLFSPTISDWERQNPVFKESVRLFITPMISSLSIMGLAQEGSESQVLGAGISIILLNVGMYFVAPAMSGILIKRKLS